MLYRSKKIIISCNFSICYSNECGEGTQLCSHWPDRETEAVPVNSKPHSRSHRSYWSAINVAAYRQSERECVSECRTGRGGAFTLHNNIGASETVEGRENAAEGGSSPERPTPGEIETDSHFLFLPFPCFLSLRLLQVFFITLHPFTLNLSVPLSILLYWLCLSCSLYSSVLHPDLLFLTYGTWQWASPSAASPPLPLSFSPPSFFLSPSLISTAPLYLIFPFLAPVHLFFFWRGDASAGGALEPRSQDAGLRSWCRGRSRGLSRWGSPLAGVGASQNASGDLRGPLAGPGTPSSHTAAQGSLESSQGRPPGARKKSGEHLGGSREGRGRGREAWHRGQERPSGR